MTSVGDHNTPLADGAGIQAQRMAAVLRDMMNLPDVIFVSPYDRTQHTLQWMLKGWPELGGVQTYEEERIREQEHGLALLYKDWRIFYAFHPKQKELYDLQGPYWYRYPQGENVPDVRDRNRLWISTLVRDYSERDVMAITHHLNILAVRANLERLNAGQFQYLDEYDKPINCGVTIYKGDPNQGKEGRFILHMYNCKLY